MAQEVECLPKKHKAPSSKARNAKTKAMYFLRKGLTM
jgi:hypothetical protein